MKKLIASLLIALSLVATPASSLADTTIGQLPLGSAAATNSGDSIPFFSLTAPIATNTQRLTLGDLINIPAFVSHYAPINAPAFTGGSFSSTGAVTLSSASSASTPVINMTTSAMFIGQADALPTSTTFDQYAGLQRTGGAGSGIYANAGSLVLLARNTATSGRGSVYVLTGSPRTQAARFDESQNTILAGQLNTPNLHNNGGTGNASNAAVSSGTYTPAQVSTNTNVASVTFAVAQWMRVGNVVTVSGQLPVTPTAGSNATTIVKFSVPIPSNLVSGTNLAGSGFEHSTGTTGAGADMIADTSNFCVTFTFFAQSTSSHNFSYTYTYVVR